MHTQNVKSKPNKESITNIDNEKQLSSKMKSKALQHQPTEKLQRLIQLVNGLPPAPKDYEQMIKDSEELAGMPLKEFEHGLWVFGEAYPDRPVTSFETLIKIFAECVEQLRGPAKEYVGPLNFETAMTLLYKEPYSMGGYPIEKTMAMALVRYNELVRARRILEEIADKGKLVKAYQRFYSQSGLWPAVSSLLSTFSGLDVSLRINEQGLVAIKPSELLDALLGAEAERIRLCPICNNIFWAGRSDQKACSKRCSNTLRVRRSRELHQERGAIYKRARIKKAEKKKPSSKDSKSAGTRRKATKLKKGK